MSFGSKNGPPSFNFVAHKVFEPYLWDFMRVCVDDFLVFGTKDQHLVHLKLCFDGCRLFNMDLNPYKSVLAVKSGILLGHVVSNEGMAIDIKNIEVL